jgi:prostaglandin-H2 D-isomerase / glutathione transferase
MAKTTLTYFDFAGSRGEECRLALHLAGIPFHDERLGRAEWAERRASAPFGALPILTVEGHAPLAQSNAILTLIGRQNGLHPTEEWESARQLAVMAAVEDMRARMAPINRITDPDEKRKAREEVAAGYLPEWGEHIERQIAGPFVGGATLGVADLKLFVATGPFLAGKIEHVPADVWKRCPKLLALVAAVKADARVQAWYARPSTP